MSSAWFILLSICKTWSVPATHTDEELKVLIGQLQVNNETTMLAETIYGLLQQGHSIEEVITMLDDGKNHAYDLRFLVTHMYNFLSEQLAEENGAPPTINNKDFEDYYARKNFWEKIDNCYLVVKIVAVILIVIILYCAYSRIIECIKLILSWFNFDFSTHSRFGLFTGEPSPENNGAVDNNQQPIEHGISHQDEVSPSQIKEAHSQQAQQEEPQLNQPSVSQQQGAIRPNPLVLSGRIENIYDRRLAEEIERDVERARNIGLVPSVVQIEVNTVEANRLARGNRRFSEMIAQQIEHAKSVGLIPMVPK